MTRLLLWRHGQTAWNAANRVQGQLDVDLSAAGRAQAQAAAARLAELHPDLIVASDLRRAADTAAALAAVTGLDVTYDARLRERHYGEWQGLTNPEITARWPEESERWRAGLPVPEFGIEDLDEVGKRVTAALQDVCAANAGATIVVASHGSAIRRGVVTLLGWPDSVLRTLGIMDNCHWVELRLDTRRGWQLRAYNAG
ncbi:histidine phosphatase family protein [Planosporangium thailandense]|uniref:Histidine phosphatase family protein n=1 Tax=Planosporangium thailandense TaxID=765197 RepID=A0ABX0Y2K9_9ACTN|nr:histidine phosphatase family protein [Planosporangium thailandense]